MDYAKEMAPQGFGLTGRVAQGIPEADGSAMHRAIERLTQVIRTNEDTIGRLAAFGTRMSGPQVGRSEQAGATNRDAPTPSALALLDAVIEAMFAQSVRLREQAELFDRIA